PPAQVRGGTVLGLDLHAHDLDEEREALFALRGVHLDRPEVGDLAHDTAPARRRVFSTAMVRTSSSVKPAARKRSAMRARPSSTGGLKTCPRSLPQTVLAAPTARVASKISSHVHLPVYGVVRARCSSAPRAASRCWSPGASLCEGNSGLVTTTVSTPT